MKESKYLISEMYAPGSFPIDWSVIPDMFLEKVSRNLYNVSAVTSEGDIIERTVIFLTPVEKFEGDTDVTEIYTGEDEKVVIGKIVERQ